MTAERTDNVKSNYLRLQAESASFIAKKACSVFCFFIAVAVLFCFVSAKALAQTSYTPPIGIPAPSFGINETVQSIYGDDNYYTHYVDNTSINPACTDTSNPNGSASKPRCTLPPGSSLTPGSVVEIHGGPYASAVYTITSSGTALQPIFFRGKAGVVRPIIERTVRVRGAYIIFENIDFNKNRRAEGAIDIRPTTTDALDSVHHIVVRNCEAHNYFDGSATSRAAGALIGFTGIMTNNNKVHDIVIYNNNIHSDNSEYPTPDAYEFDYMGVSVASMTDKVWILDNEIHHNAGDAIGTGNGSNYTATNYYIGRNNMHHNGENAVDLKEVKHFIISQNKMHDHYGESAGSDGTTLVFHYGGGNNVSAQNIWVLFNEIYNASDKGIQIGGGASITSPDEIYCVGNIIHDIYNSSGTGQGFVSWGSDRVYVIGNVVYNTDQGLDFTGSGTSSAATVINNIFGTIQNTSGYHLAMGPTAYRNSAVIDNNLFYQPNGSARFSWNTLVTGVANFKSASGKCLGCLEGDPLFTDPSSMDFSLQPMSPAINAGDSALIEQIYSTFESRFPGSSIRYDYENTPRPQGYSWDIGAYEYISYVPPIGIPAPSFGINEVAPSWPAEWPSSQAINYYYIDNTNPSATDANNTYGYPDKPRMTIPANKIYSAGTYIEIHGGPYSGEALSTTLTATYYRMAFNCTQQNPCWVRGTPTSMPIIDASIRLGVNSQYFIMEYLDFNGGTGMSIGSSYSMNHIAIRNSNFRNKTWVSNSSGIGIGAGTGVTAEINNIVVYNNIFKDLDYDPAAWALTTQDHDFHGMTVGSNSTSQTHEIWFLNNYCEKVGGNCIQVNGGNWPYSYKYTHHIYVGNNTATNLRQAGFWSKMASDVIFSQNTVYNNDKWGSQSGDGFGYQYNPHNTWFIFNKVHDTNIGMRQSESMSVSDGWNLIGNSGGKWYVYNQVRHNGIVYQVKLTHVPTADNEPGIGASWATYWEASNGTAEDAYDQRKIYIIGNEFRDIYPRTAGGVGTYDANNIWRGGGVGAAFWHGTEQRWLVDNTFVNVYDGVTANAPGKLTISGNIIDGRNINGYQMDIGNAYLVTNADYNNWYDSNNGTRLRWRGVIYNSPGALYAGQSQCKNCIDTDPLFINKENKDFHLQSDSGAEDVGLESSVYNLFYSLYGIDIKKDIAGNSRPQGIGWDIGAYEYASGNTQPADTTAPTTTALPAGGTYTSTQTVTFSINESAATYYTLDGSTPTTASAVYSTPIAIGANTTLKYFSQDIAGNAEAVKTESYIINIPNNPPVLNAIGNKSVEENSILTFTLSGTDADNDTLTYSAVDLPLGAIILENTFTWAPDYTQAGSYTVTFIVSDGKDSASETIAITVKDVIPPDTTAPTVPIGLSATAVLSTQISLSWTAATDNIGVTGYKIYRDGVLAQTIIGGAVVIYSDTGLTPNTIYNYTISALDAAGNESVKSSLVSAKTLTSLDTIENISLIRQDCSGYSNCYTSLFAWESAKQRDLVTLNQIETVKIEGVWTIPDIKSLIMDGWTTDENHYIKIYTTPEARHSGMWDANKYRLEISAAGDYAIDILIRESFVTIDGLQIHHKNNDWNYGAAIKVDSNTYIIPGAKIYISNNIVKSTEITTANDTVKGISLSGTNGTYYVWNNIIYDFNTFGAQKSNGISAYGIAYIYNNTLINNAVGIYGSGKIVAKNNIVQGSIVDGFEGSFDSSSNYNISDLPSPDALGVNSKNLAVVSFRDPVNKDFHLFLDDKIARNSGTNLSADSNFQFTADIDGQSHPDAWDIGADEEISASDLPDTISPLTPANISALAVSQSRINLSWGISMDNIAVMGYKIYRNGIFIGDTIYNNYSDTGLDVSTLYTYTVSAYDSAGNNSNQSTLVSEKTYVYGSSGYEGGSEAKRLSSYDKTRMGKLLLQDLLSFGYKYLIDDGEIGYWGLNAIRARQDITTKPYSLLRDANGYYQSERVIFSDLTTGATMMKLTNQPYGQGGDELMYFGKANYNADGSLLLWQRSKTVGIWGPSIQTSDDVYGQIRVNSDGTSPKIVFRNPVSIYGAINSPTDSTKSYAMVSGGSLGEFDLISGNFLRNVATGLGIWWLKLSPDGKYATVKPWGSAPLWVVDLNDGTKYTTAITGSIHDSYRFVPGNTDWVMYWKESDGVNRMYNYKTNVEKILPFKFDWNHGDIGRSIGVHVNGNLYSFANDDWVKLSGNLKKNGYDYYAVTWNGYLAHWPDDQLWAYPTTIIERPFLSEISEWFSQMLSGGTESVNRFRLFLTNLSRTTDRKGNATQVFDRPNISPDGTKILFNSNVFGQAEVYVAQVKKPLSVKSLTATWTGSGVSLSWTTPKYAKEIKGYRIFRSNESGQSFAQINSEIINGNSYTDSTAATGKVYFYALRSVENSSFESELSREVGVSSDSLLLNNAPRRIFIEAEDVISADLNSPSPDAMWVNFDGYASNLYYLWQRRIDKMETLPLTVNIPNNGQYYVFARVKGKDGVVFNIAGQNLSTTSQSDWKWIRSDFAVSLTAGNQVIDISSSKYGSAVDAFYLSTDANFIPQGRSLGSVPNTLIANAVNSGGYVKISWDPSSDMRFHHYNVYVSSDPAFIPDRQTLIASPDKLSYLDWQILTGEQYYKITQVNLDGFESLPSNVVSLSDSNIVDTFAPTTTIAPVGGTYASAQSVILSVNETATTYYTLDGSTPTTASAVYSSPISITANTTLKYFSQDPAGNAEAVKTESYVINIPNNPPVLNAIGNKSGEENSILTFALSASDADNDALIYSAVDLPQGAILLENTFTWAPDYTQSGSYTITFMVSDSKDTDTKDITITVNNINRPPTIQPFTVTRVNENDIVILTPDAIDLDGDALTYSISGLPPDADYTFNNATGILNWKTKPGEAGAYTITVSADDGIN